jgi:hypothetical protein
MIPRSIYIFEFQQWHEVWSATASPITRDIAANRSSLFE